jgi:hypothetical protein
MRLCCEPVLMTKRKLKRDETLKPSDLATVDAVLTCWRRLSAIEREEFLVELTRAAMRLGGDAARDWLAEELGKPPLSVDLSGQMLTQADKVATPYTPVGREQFEVKENEVVHKPTGALFIAFPGDAKPYFVDWGQCGSVLPNGDNFSQAAVQDMAVRIIRLMRAR